MSETSELGDRMRSGKLEGVTIDPELPLPFEVPWTMKPLETTTVRGYLRAGPLGPAGHQLRSALNRTSRRRRFDETGISR